MPQTVPYGFETEALGEEPTRTLNGGSDGLSPRLGEQVNDELLRIDTDLSDVQGRVTTIEQEGVLGWTYIAHGVASGDAFSIDVTAGGKFPAGTFDMLRLHGRFGLDDVGTVRLRVNGLTGAHGMGYVVHNAGGALELSDHGSGLNQWVIGYGGTALTNNFICTIFHTSGENAVNYQATGSRMSSSLNSHRRMEAWGYLSEGRLVSSLELRPFTPTANDFLTIWWWLEGFKIP